VAEYIICFRDHLKYGEKSPVLISFIPRSFLNIIFIESFRLLHFYSIVSDSVLSCRFDNADGHGLDMRHGFTVLFLHSAFAEHLTFLFFCFSSRLSSIRHWSLVLVS